MDTFRMDAVRSEERESLADDPVRLHGAELTYFILEEVEDKLTRLCRGDQAASLLKMRDSVSE